MDTHLNTPAPSHSARLSQLFWVFFRIGAFTFGGGYAMLPLIRAEVVERQEWLAADEFIDIIGVAQCAPGAVAINTAIFIGYKLFGLPGAVIAATGVVCPSFIVILLIATVFVRFQDVPAVAAFFRGVRPAVTALIAAAALKMGRTVLRDRFRIVLAIVAFAVLYLLGLHPIPVLAAGGFAGWLAGRRTEGGQC